MWFWSWIIEYEFYFAEFSSKKQHTTKNIESFKSWILASDMCDWFYSEILLPLVTVKR